MKWMLLLEMDGPANVKAMHKIPVHIIAENKEKDRAGVSPPVSVTLELPLPPDEEAQHDEEDAEETCITFDMD